MRTTAGPILAAGAAAILMAVGCAKPTAAPAPTTTSAAPQTLRGAAFLTSRGDRWKLHWHDEFNGGALDTAKWKIGLPWKGSDGEGRHHDNRYASYIVDHNVVVEGGVLKLLTRREDVTDRRGRTFHYTQGLITTAHAFRHRYGYWEARVKIPADAGPGLWPAFWTLAEGWPPEMDICEVWTSNNRSHQGMAYRPAGAPREKWDDFTTHDPLPRGWTTFGMEWGPGYQVYNINRRVTKRVYGDHVTNDAHYILLNSGVESQRPPTAETVFPNAFQVDYVRVYARPDVPALHNGGFENEDGLRPWQRTGTGGRASKDVHGGTYALHISGNGAAEQKIYGLTPNTTYVLRGWAKARGGEARLGVKDYGGDERSARTTSGSYRALDVRFTTGPDATTATVYCNVPTDGGETFFDDISLRE